MSILPDHIEIELNSDHDYLVTFINPGDDLAMVYEIWWGQTPSTHLYEAKSGLASIELTGRAFLKENSAEQCLKNETIFHLKIQGTVTVPPQGF